MFNDPVSFNGGTRVEVIAVLANCGRDTDRARRALVTWIRHKQDKGRTTEHILIKLRDIESKFIKDASLHNAFRDARAETFLPRAPDLPLPYSVRRNSESHSPEYPVSTPRNTGPGVTISSSAEPPTDSIRQTSPPASPSRLSRNPSQKPDIFPEKKTTRRSLPQGVPRILPSPSARIQIPRDRTLQSGPSSPITSSPEEPGIHLRYRYKSHPVAPSYQSHGLMTPSSPSPPESSWSLVSSREQNPAPGRASHGLFLPIPSPPRVQIPRTRSRRSIPTSPMTSSSDESDFRHRYRPLSQPVGSMSPSIRRVTPPRTSPPSVPLPPIPSDDQGLDSDSDRSGKDMPTEQPPTPLRSPISISPTIVRPLPIQPIPSPVPGSDESENADIIAESLSRQHGEEADGELLPLDDVVRQDSPLYVFHDDHGSLIGIGPPPPYADQLDTYFPPDMPTIGDTLDRAVKVCGGSADVRAEVSRCIGFQRGYEPPYWQTRLQASGLNAEAARYLVDEMCKQVDWTASANRAS